MAKFTIQINVAFKNSSGETESHQVEVEAVLPESGPKTIDNVEKAILKLNKEAIHQAVVTYFEALAKKKAREQQEDYGGTILANSTPYRVDGEIGRFEFTTYRLDQPGGESFNTATHFFEPIASREYYRTDGFNELALFLASSMSYRKATVFLNRVRWQTDHGTPMRTLAHVVETEGQQIQEVVNDMTEDVLTRNQFDTEGMPQEETEKPTGLAPEEASLPKEYVAEALEHYNKGKTEEFHIDAAAADQFYENPEVTVNVSIDDVGVKKQKETGRSPAKHRKKNGSMSTIRSPM